MHSNQQLWLEWSRGEITDDDAQAAAETAAARRQRRYAWAEAKATPEAQRIAARTASAFAVICP
jgi:hypothetical protein